MIRPMCRFGRLESVVAAVLVAIAMSSGPAHAAGEPARVRGTVVSLDGSNLVVHTKDGKDVPITLADKFGAIEPPRFFRRPLCLGHAAIAGSISMAK